MEGGGGGEYQALRGEQFDSVSPLLSPDEQEEQTVCSLIAAMRLLLTDGANRDRLAIACVTWWMSNFIYYFSVDGNEFLVVQYFPEAEFVAVSVVLHLLAVPGLLLGRAALRRGVDPVLLQLGGFAAMCFLTTLQAVLRVAYKGSGDTAEGNSVFDPLRTAVVVLLVTAINGGPQLTTFCLAFVGTPDVRSSGCTFAAAAACGQLGSLTALVLIHNPKVLSPPSLSLCLP